MQRFPLRIKYSTAKRRQRCNNQLLCYTPLNYYIYYKFSYWKNVLPGIISSSFKNAIHFHIYIFLSGWTLRDYRQSCLCYFPWFYPPKWWPEWEENTAVNNCWLQNTLRSLSRPVVLNKPGEEGWLQNAPTINHQQQPAWYGHGPQKGQECWWGGGRGGRGFTSAP